MSFSSADLAAAKEVSEYLESAAIPTFFAPRDIRGGMNFAVEIVKAIAACDVVVVLLSESSVNSPHVRREVSLAIDERRAILPLAMPGTTYPASFGTEWVYWLSAVQVMPYDGPPGIIARLRALLPEATPTHHRPEAEASLPTPRTPLRRRLAAGKTSPSALLRPDGGLPILMGREGELARLEQWCLRDDDFDVRILTGAAGQGKTRLARELGRTLELVGWETRFVVPTASGVDTVIELPSRPTLLVIDYAETRGDQLTDMLNSLLEHGLLEKVRLLLLARTAADWWKSLVARDAEVAELLAETTVQPIELLTLNRDFVNQLFVDAHDQFGKELQRDSAPVAAAPYKPYGSILEVLADALGAVLGGSSDAGSGTDRLLAHERRYLAACARSEGIAEVDDADLNRIAAGLTLYGAATEDEAKLLIAECNRDLDPRVRRKVARLFRRLYPGTRTYVDGLRPDALAEDLIAGILADDGALPGSEAGINGNGRTPEQQRRALTMLARGAMRHESVAAELDKAIRNGDRELLKLAIEVASQVEEPDRLSTSIAEAISERPQSDLATLLDAIPDETVALALLAAQLARQAIAYLPEADGFSSKDVEIAMACSNRFSDAGWSAEAADSAQLAVDRIQLMDAAIRDGRIFGRGLTNLSNRLWELGKLAESLEPAQRAVEVLTATQAPALELAAARSNLGFRLAELGRSDEAAGEVLEAERLCRNDESGTDADRTRMLGSSLNNLTCIGLALGDARQALAHGSACVDLRRSQALQSRDRYLPYVARALANTAPAAEVCGESELSNRLIIEARSLHSLTGQRAPIFRFEQAESATLHALILLSRQNWSAAAEATAEARELFASVDVDLGDLGTRLAATLDRIQEFVDSRRAVALSDIATGTGTDLRLPQLLEYRDL